MIHSNWYRRENVDMMRDAKKMHLLFSSERQRIYLDLWKISINVMILFYSLKKVTNYQNKIVNDLQGAVMIVKVW